MVRTPKVVVIVAVQFKSVYTPCNFSFVDETEIKRSVVELYFKIS